MLAVHENDKIESKRVSIRYDQSTRTYYCFYHKTENFSSELILSFGLDDGKWTVESKEYQDIFERKFNEFFSEKNIPFEEQIRYVINYLDTYFAERLQQTKTKINVVNHRVYSFGWLRRLRGIRRWASHNILCEPSPVLQRYSAPAKSTYLDKDEQIMSVKTLAELFYTDELARPRRRASNPSFDYLHEPIPTLIPSKAPAITEIWLNVMAQEMDDFRRKIGNRNAEEKLKKLAEKFVTYFSGTLQCNVGHQYQLDFDGQRWSLTVLKVEFLTKKSSESGKLPKTKIIFLIDGIPHYVRG